MTLFDESYDSVLGQQRQDLAMQEFLHNKAIQDQKMQQSQQLIPLEIQAQQQGMQAQRQQMEHAAIKTQMEQDQMRQATAEKNAQQVGLKAFMNTVGGAQSGPNVRSIPLQGQPEAPVTSFESVAASLIRKNPQLANDPVAFSTAMEQMKPIIDATGKEKFERFKLELEQQNRAAESPMGKVAQDRARGILPKLEDGGVKITELPDAQSRKAALDFSKALDTIPSLREQFAKAKQLNSASFESDLIPADMKVLATRAAGKSASEEDKAQMLATTQYEQLIKQTILPRLRATFGGRITNFEVQFLNDIEGKTRMSKAERDALIEQSLEFIAMADAEARDGLTSLGVKINEPRQRETAPMTGLPAGWSVVVGK